MDGSPEATQHEEQNNKSDEPNEGDHHAEQKNQSQSSQHEVDSVDSQVEHAHKADATMPDENDVKRDKYDFSEENIQSIGEQYHFAMFPVCIPHMDRDIRRPSAFLRAEVRRACNDLSIPYSEIHGDDKEICVVCTSEDAKDRVLLAANKIIANLTAPLPMKYAIRIESCFMLTDQSLRALLQRIGDVVYLKTGHSKAEILTNFSPLRLPC